MNNSNSWETGSYIVPVVAAFVSVSMSICFSRFISLDTYGIGCLLTISAITSSYFLAFYAISTTLYSESATGAKLVVTFLFSILIILIGMSDIRGIFIKIWLWWLMATLLGALLKAEDRKMHPWYSIIFIFLAFSTVFSLTNSPELLVEDENLIPRNLEHGKDSYIHSTFSFQVKAENYGASNVKVKIVCPEQVLLDEGEYAFLDIGSLKENEEKIIRWNIVIKCKDSHSFFLYLASSEKVSNKRVIVYPEGEQWKVRIEDVGFLRNLSIFLRNNPLFSSV